MGSSRTPMGASVSPLCQSCGVTIIGACRGSPASLGIVIHTLVWEGHHPSYSTYKASTFFHLHVTRSLMRSLHQKDMCVCLCGCMYVNACVCVCVVGKSSSHLDLSKWKASLILLPDMVFAMGRRFYLLLLFFFFLDFSEIMWSKSGFEWGVGQYMLTFNQI